MDLDLNKLKKTLFSMAFAVLASSGMFYPVFASAFTFPSFFAVAHADDQQSTTSDANSQNVRLPTAAVNSNPAHNNDGSEISVSGGALVAKAGPDGTTADIVDRPESSTISVYTVHPGDTLSEIAQMFGVSVGTIVGANNLQGKTIHVGDQLIILPITGIRYTVQKSDTLTSLAKKYKSDAGDIAQYNDLATDASLVVGAMIIIPNGELPQAVATTPAKKASTKSTEPYLGGSGPALSGYYAWPLASGQITQGLHGYNGVDIGAPQGTPIFAAAAGTVLVARDNGAWNGGYGNYIVIQHDNGTQTLYAHIKTGTVLVSVGQQVAQSQQIASVGHTGEVSGPTGNHLHFEVRGAANPFASLGVGYRR